MLLKFLAAALCVAATAAQSQTIAQLVASDPDVSIIFRCMINRLSILTRRSLKKADVVHDPISAKFSSSLFHSIAPFIISCC